MSNIAYPDQHIPHGSRDHVIIPDTVKITFNLDIESTDKARSVANNVGRALVKKKVLMVGSKDIDTINNPDIYDTYKDLYLSKKEHEEKLLQVILQGILQEATSRYFFSNILSVGVVADPFKKCLFDVSSFLVVDG